LKFNLLMKIPSILFIFLLACFVLQNTHAAGCIDTNCETCDDPTICTACQFGFYLGKTDGACYKCSEACVGCTGIQTSLCENCANGYYFTALSLSCEDCGSGFWTTVGQFGKGGCSYCTDANCHRCSGSGAGNCIACKPGFYWDSATTTCIACAAGTSSTPGATTAKECLPCQDESCSSCTALGTGRCLSCLAGTYLSSATCPDCDVGKFSADGAISADECFTCADENCDKCSTDQPDTCTKCVSGYFLDGTECKQCADSDCLACSGADEAKCTSCPANFSLEKGLCVACKEGTYSETGSNKCSSKLLER